MELWIIYSLIAIVLWGFWSFFGKLATNYIPSTSIKIVDTIGFLIIAVILLFVTKFKIPSSKIGIGYAILAGLFAASGGVFYYLALKNGKLSAVVHLTSLYVAVTVLLSVLILKENINLLQGAGIVLAIVAAVLLSL